MTWLERICAVHERSERAAVIGEMGSVSGRDLIGKAVAAADLLTDLDVQAGQPILALLTTNAHSLALLLGGAAVNRPLAPLGPRQTPAELTETVRRSGSSVLLAEAAFAETARQVADAVGIRAMTIPSCQYRGVRYTRNQVPRRSTCTQREQPEFPSVFRSATECSTLAPRFCVA